MIINGCEIITLKTWNDVRQFVDDSPFYFSPSYLDRVNSRKYPVDAFSLGQLASKSWFMYQSYFIRLQDNKETVIVGSWVGSIVESLLKSYDIQKIYGLDIDPEAIRMGDEFNARYVQDNWRFKGIVADATYVNLSHMELSVEGQLIESKPGVIINTSCEHMSNEWYDTVNSKQLVIIQTNNSKDFEGHINTCDSLAEMKEKYPMTDLLYSGELQLPIYTRYMMIGHK